MDTSRGMRSVVVVLALTAVVPAPAAGRASPGCEQLADGSSYLDRTTLSPLAGGEVRQHIEVSTDRGESWRTTFDAVYRRVSGAPR